MTRISHLLVGLVALAGISTTGCASSPYYGDSRDYYDARHDRYNDRYDNRYRGCIDCGVVTRIDSYYGGRRTTGVGAVTGAVVGGVLGNQVGSGSGKKAATVAGAVLGGLAGNRIEKRNRSDRPTYVISVAMDDGRRLTLERRDIGGLRVGDPVIVRNGRVALR